MNHDFVDKKEAKFKMLGYKNRSDGKLSEKIETMLRIGKDLGYWSHGYDFPRRCKQIFKSAKLNGKNMLEIGCGKGLFSIWASLHGADHVVGLEPLDDGSFDSSVIFSDFKKITNLLELSNVELLSERVQDYKGIRKYFDIILSVASINHLDEDSCIRLKESQNARGNYTQIFNNISDLMKEGGKLIILDCSNRNFFADIGISNPIAKSIQRIKHQTPEFWAQLLEECGFSEPEISWPSGRYSRYMGINNHHKFSSYFLESTFRLEMTKKKNKK